MPECTGFDWSGGNDEKNRGRHDVTPQEAEEVFFNAPLLAGRDEAHSQTETRFYVLGQTDRGRELFVAFTVREAKIRVISARDMSRKERSIYHE